MKETAQPALDARHRTGHLAAAAVPAAVGTDGTSATAEADDLIDFLGLGREQGASVLVYAPDRYAIDGFVHCSSRAQVLGPATRLFRGRTDLVLLVIDPARLGAPVIEEQGVIRSAETFPHVYGPIELDAVTRVVDFPSEPEGRFALPDLDD